MPAESKRRLLHNLEPSGRGGVNRPATTSAWLALIVLSVLFYSAVAGSTRADIVGVASVIDADTIEIHGQRIRLHGIDAPESGQTCFDDDGRSWRCGQRTALAL